MPGFWTALAATLAAHAVTLLGVYLFVAYNRGEPAGLTGVKFLDKVIDIGANGAFYLVSAIVFFSFLYIVFF